MAMPKAEFERRMKSFTEFLHGRDLDFGIVYFDEFNKMNGRYLIDFWSSVEKGAVVVSKDGKSVVVGGPECGPYAREQSLIKDIRFVSEFMVHNEEYPTSEITTIAEVFEDLSGGKAVKRVGLIGYDRVPAAIYDRIKTDLTGVELVDVTFEFEECRHIKSPYEIGMIAKACQIMDEGIKAMTDLVHEGIPEYRAVAAAEFAVRDRGAEGFDFSTILASGERGLTAIGRASEKKFVKGESVLTGLNCKYHGYAAAVAHPFVVDSEPTVRQAEIMKMGLEAHERAIAALRPGATGKQIDAAARHFLTEHGLGQYHLWGSCHTIGLNEYEEPFFGPNCEDVLQPNMTVCVDITLIGHPDFPGLRYEEALHITEDGPRPLSEYMVAYRERLRRSLA